MTDSLSRLTAALADRYAVETQIGEGGMATVYLARDLKHDRQVAVKVLRPELSAVIGADRFLAEIKTTANLQHPHILPLHDSGEVNGTVFYVMPFVEGESLRDRLDREKQLPVAEAVRITSEVASALDYAHRHDVIHRDIKPENILLHDGQALVADFGIALAASKGEGSSRMTETGMSLGTPTYMSPEQAMGERDLDGRTDVYALGCMLYEMLAGEPPFTGPTAQAIVAKVMSSEPEPVTTLRRVVPPGIAVAVHTALQKLPVDRFATAAEFAAALSSPSTSQFSVASAGASGVLPGLSVTASRMAFGILAVLALVATWFAIRPTPEGNAIRTTRMAIDLPPGQGLLAPGGIRVSFAPDGESFYYMGPGPTRPMVWRRSLDQLEATQVAGTEGATSAVASPDGTQVAFVTLSPFTLRVVRAAGGQPRLIVSDSISGGGLAWSDDGYIYFDGNTGMARIRPDGTDRSMVMPLDASVGESGIAWPEALPDGRGLVVRVRRGGEEMSAYRIVAYDARDGSHKELVVAVGARYSPTGHLLFVTATGELFAQRFDLDRLELLGRPLLLWSGLRVGGFGTTDLSISSAGDLLYTGGRIRNSIADLVWVDRTGQSTPIDPNVEEGLIRDVQLSPDGTAIAMEILRPTGSSDVARIYIKRIGGPTQLVSTEQGQASAPVWMPSGEEILYESSGVGLVRRRADASGAAERVFGTEVKIRDVAVDPTGSTLVMVGDLEFSDADLAHFRIGVDTAIRPLLNEAGVENEPEFSPDGRWLAYASSGSGRAEVYLRPYPDVESMKIQLSTDGGRQPKWNRSGDELFYVDGNGDLIAVALSPSGRRDVVERTTLFSVSGYQSRGGVSYYDVAPDGERFLMLDIGINSADAGTEPLVIVHNFLTELGAMEFPE